MALSAKAKTFLQTLLGGLVAMGMVALVFRLAQELRVSYWLAGCATTTIVSLVGLVWQRRVLDRLRVTGLILFAAGFGILTAASVVNEYISPFFAPSRIYVLLALVPCIAYLCWRELADRHLTFRSRKDGPDGPPS
jgi:peptidoglycan/LPS O-acetylase OafA/YrhL